MQDANLEAILRRAAEELHCPVCEHGFELDDLKVRGAFERQYLVQASCRRSHGPLLILYVVGQGTKSQRLDAVTTDHVLDLHQQLRTFNGDFRTLFKQLDDQSKK